MQNPLLKFRQSLLSLRKQRLFYPKSWKLCWASTSIEFNIFCWNFAQVSYLPMPTIGCSGFFILFRSSVIEKLGFCECVETRSFLILANSSRSKHLSKIKEIANTHPFVDKVGNMCEISTKVIKLYGSWSSSVFNLTDIIPDFSKTKDLCLNFCIGFCIT